MRMLLFVLFAFSASSTVEAGVPQKLEGIRLGWKKSKVLKLAKKKKWNKLENKKKKCRSVIAFRFNKEIPGKCYKEKWGGRKGPRIKCMRGIRLSIYFQKGRVYKIWKDFESKNPELVGSRRWNKFLQKARKKYGRRRTCVQCEKDAFFTSGYRYSRGSRELIFGYHIAADYQQGRDMTGYSIVGFLLRNRWKDRKYERCLRRLRDSEQKEPRLP